MALYRQPNICPFCGEEIKCLYNKQEGVPDMMKVIGDTFIGYENHVCDAAKKKEWLISDEAKEAIDNWQKLFD